MKCPLLLFEHYTTFEKIGSEVADCLKEECAWWDDRLGRCAVLTISRIMIDVGRQVEAIQSKMPHEEQP